MARRHRRSRIGDALYWLRYRIGEFFLRGFVALMPWIPRALLLLVTEFAARTSYLVLWRYRKRMQENLAIAMGKGVLRPKETGALALKIWRNFAHVGIETALSMYSSKEEILSAVRIEGEENLQQALAKGKGAIALSAHVGNFTMIGIRLAAGNYPFSNLVKQPRDEGFARLFDHYRAVVGVKSISTRPRREAVRQVLKALRRNEVVLLIADEFKSGGVEVEFLGSRVSAQRGPVTLAMRAGAPLLPMFVTRDERNHLTLYIEPELRLAQTGDVQEDMDANVARFIGELETMVRRYPDQWNWLGFRRNGATPRSEIGVAAEPTSSDRATRFVS